MSPPLTRDILDALLADQQRQDPTSSVLGILPRCHPEDGIEARYQGNGILALACHACQREFARVLLRGMAVLVTGREEPRA